LDVREQRILLRGPSTPLTKALRPHLNRSSRKALLCKIRREKDASMI
jgi:hypothetical protein